MYYGMLSDFLRKRHFASAYGLGRPRSSPPPFLFFAPRYCDAAVRLLDLLVEAAIYSVPVGMDYGVLWWRFR